MTNPRHIHFIGIGGIGMSGIAQLFMRRGIKVSGSDLRENAITSELKKNGAAIFTGHKPENLLDCDEVVYSSAIKEDNPEITEARRRGITILKRAQALAQLMEGKTVITVAGSHGKTTTTSLVSYLLLEAGLCPAAAIGGILKNINTNACPGDGRYFVAEADESDGSFLYYEPKYSIVTNIDREHMDYYADLDAEIETFREFIGRTKANGCVFACNDDLNLKNILKGYKSRYVLYGLTDEADIYAKNITMKGLSSQFDCFYHSSRVARFSLALGGTHNISNALAGIALGLELGIDVKTIEKVLKGYKGAGRRIEVKLNDGDHIFIDDYAHHPTEIKATLSAIKNLKAKRVIAIFQPHRYSRTKLLMEDFTKCFGDADLLILTDIYAASEKPIEGIDSSVLSGKIKDAMPQKEVLTLAKDKIASRVMDILKPGDLVITLGAGDIVKVCDELVEKFKRESPV